MARIIKWASIVLVALLLLALAVPFLIPLERYRQLAQERVKALTGREMVIAGAIQPSFWPHPGISLSQVTLSNPPGFSTPHLADVGTLTAEIELMPLLSGEVRIRRFIAERPVIQLEVNRQGQANWQFSPAQDQQMPKAPPAEAPKASAIPVLGSVKIDNGAITYRDERNKQLYAADGIDLTLSMPSAASPLELAAGLNWNKERVNLTAHIDQPAALADSGSNMKASLSAGDMANVTLNGKASLRHFNGVIDVTSASLVRLAQWSATPFEWRGATPLSLSVKGPLECGTNQCALTGSAIALDAIKMQGDVTITAGIVPQVEAKLSSDLLDITPYLPAEKHTELTLVSAAQAAGWSDDKIDLSALRSLNATLSLNAGKLICRSLHISQLALSLRLQNGELALRIPHFETYGGSGSLSVNANASNRLTAEFAAQHLAIEKPLKDFAQFDRLSGLAELKGSLSAQGASQRALIQSLNGNGSVRLTDGAIRGIDLAQMVRNARALITGADTAAQKTDFSELSGTYRIGNGILNNNDLAMKAPLLRLRGEGRVDLPQQQVYYHLFPSLVGTLQGQGGKDKTGLEVPVLVEGSFERLSFTPDLKSLATDALQNPEKMKNTIKSLKGEVTIMRESIKEPGGMKDLLKGLGR